VKRVLLICPDKNPALEPVMDGVTLTLTYFLGKPLIDRALEGLAAAGGKQVRVLVCDRPTEVRIHIGDGEAWGMDVEVVAESRELDCEAALEKHASFGAEAALRLGKLPQAGGLELLSDPAAWHHGRKELLTTFAAGEVGSRELKPGVWAGLRAVIDPSAELIAPCWIGPNAVVRARAVVGPHAFVESDSLVDRQAVVEDSTVARHTYLGEMTHMKDSVARGGSLLNWRNGSCVEIVDSFLMSPMRGSAAGRTNLLSRFLALLVLALTWPVVLWAGLKAIFGRKPFWEQREAVIPSRGAGRRRVIEFREFGSIQNGLRRWPRLWRIVTGHFGWTGNPPLTPIEVAELEGDFERLWVDVSPGFFTAPEGEGCVAPWDDEARAHASLFVCHPTPAWRWRIIRRGVRSLIFFQSP
jgi:hypothetical protein